MADKSPIKTWGSTGDEHPDGYSHLAGEQAVANWENYFKHTAVDRINHILTLTQNRLDSGAGASYPTSPSDGHLFWGNGKLSVRDGDSSAWKEIAFKAQVDNVDSELQGHKAATDNPHGVTASQAGAAPESHLTDTANPHGVTASQIGALETAGGSVSGNLDLSAGTLVLPTGVDKYATQ